MPALSFPLFQPAGSLLTPRLPVVVLEDHLNKNTAVFCRDQGLGNPWQAQLLNGHQHLLGGAINGFNQPCLHVVTIAPLPCEG